MAEPRDPESEQSPYLSLPWPAVAAGLVGVLVVALAIGVWANQSRSQAASPVVAAVAEPAGTPVSKPAGTPVAALTSPLAPTPTPAPQAFVDKPVAMATAIEPAPTTVPTATVIPTVAASATAVESSTAVPLPTVDPVLAEEVGSAYEAFWRVRSQALLDLDTSHLGEVMAGDYISRETELIDELSAEDRAIKTVVVLNYSVVDANEAAATVVDNVKDDSVYVKRGTEVPLASATTDYLKIVYKLMRFEDGWKVTEGASAS